jgi:hypothetical protein
VRRALLLLALSFGLLGCPGSPGPTAADVAAYFGLKDGTERVYVNEQGLEETHALQRSAVHGDREIYQRLARRSGFVHDESTFQLEASVERGLEITRFLDCVTRCGELSAPIAFLPWPLLGGESLQSEVELRLEVNGEEQEPRDERHSLQVGTLEERTVPAGIFEGYRVLWTRTAGEDVRTLELFVAPDEGLVVTEGVDGVRFELSEVR